VAQIRLTRLEAERGTLPYLCMRCGSEADVISRRRFTWRPLWARILLGVVADFVMTQRMRVQVTLCDQCEGHWRRRTWAVWGGFAAMVFAGIGAMVLAFAVQEAGLAKVPGGLIGIAWLSLALAWLVFIPFSDCLILRAVEITKKNITLAGVSPTYVEAVRSARDKFRSIRKIPREPRRQTDSGTRRRERDRPPSREEGPE